MSSTDEVQTFSRKGLGASIAGVAVLGFAGMVLAIANFVTTRPPNPAHSMGLTLGILLPSFAFLLSGAYWWRKVTKEKYELSPQTIRFVDARGKAAETLPWQEV